jgi:hypothetical protein
MKSSINHKLVERFTNGIKLKMEYEDSKDKVDELKHSDEEKRIRKYAQNIQDLWNTIKRSNR